MSAIDVVIPCGTHDDAQRVSVREWIAQRWEQTHGLPVTVAMCASRDWSKGVAVNAVVAQSTADLIVVADADSFVSDESLRSALEIAAEVGWSMPHSHVKRLSRHATTEIMAGRESNRLERASYPALPGGGIVIATKEAWRMVRGIDPRFVGWGGEDHALGLAFAALVGPINKRRAAPLWHLWHPPAPNCRKPSQAARDLDARYRAARNNATAMASLVKEW